jgi:hypothetical protein
LAVFKAANYILDTTGGLAVGAGESIVDTLKSVPEMIGLSFKFGLEYWKMTNDPELAVKNLAAMIDAIPELRQDFYKALNSKLNALTGADDYERARLFGGVAVDVIVNCLTDGGKTGVQALNALEESTLALKKSGALLNAMDDYVPKVTHLFDSAENFQFYSPGTSANPFTGADKFIAETFSGATFMSYDTTKPMRVLRVYSEDKNRFGRFLTDIPRSGSSAAMDLSLIKATGNDASKWTLFEIPAGVTVYEGRAASYQVFEPFNSATGKYIPNEVFTGGVVQYFIHQEDVKKLKVIQNGHFQK